MVFHSPYSQLDRKSPEEGDRVEWGRLDELCNPGSGLIRVEMLPVRMDLSSKS